MASTVLPNGIIVPEKFSRDWYADLYHNWQELDNLLGGGTPKDGTLTIQKNGTTVGTFSANQATDETVNIEVPDVNNGTLTIQQNGTAVDTFTANSSSDKTVNIQCVDLTNNQTVGGNKEFTGTTTAHDLVPSATETYNFGSPSYQWNNAYIKSLTINGVACGDILTHNVSEFVNLSSNQTIDGNKTFSNGLFASKNEQGDLATLVDSSINSTNEDANGMPLTGHANSVKIKGSQFNVVPCMLTGQLFTSGDTSAELRTYKYKDTTTNAIISLRYTYATNNGNVYFSNISSLISNVTNTANLGSPSLQWNNTYTRHILIDNDINIWSSVINKTSNSGSLSLRGGTNYADGASLSLYGKDYGGSPGLIGNIYMTAHNGTTNTTLVIRSTGEVILDNALVLKANADNTCSCGASDRRWTEVYSATGTINTSDARLKNSVKDIDDALLDAWGNIEPKQYKFNDATEKKGEKARYHTGYLAQDIQAECEKQGVNASDYGLFCYDEWEEQQEEIEEIETEKDGKIVKEKRVIQPKREKGNSYALRYEEALVVECMYLRRCIARLTARIEELEKGNNTK